MTYRWIIWILLPLLLLCGSLASGAGISNWDHMEGLKRLDVKVELDTPKGPESSMTYNHSQLLKNLVEIRAQIKLLKTGVQNEKALKHLLRKPQIYVDLLVKVGRSVPAAVMKEHFATPAQAPTENFKPSSLIRFIMTEFQDSSFRVRVEAYLESVQKWSQNQPLGTSGQSVVAVKVPPSAPPVPASASAPAPAPVTWDDKLHQWEKLKDGSRVLKLKIGHKTYSVDFPIESKMQTKVGQVVSEAKSTDVFDALTRKTSIQVGWSLTSFMAAFYAYNEFKFLTAGDNQDPVARQRQMEQVLTPEFAASMVPFAAYQYWYTTRLLGSNKVSALFGFGENGAARMGFSSFMRNWSFGATRMVPLIMVSAMIHQYGRYFRACSEYKKINTRNTVDNPTAGAPGMTDSDRQEAVQICNQGFSLWSKEGVDLFGPMFLSGIATMGILSALPATGMIGKKVKQKILTTTPGAGAAKYTKLGLHKMGEYSLAAAKNASAAGKGLRYTINGVRLAFSGGRWVTGVAVGASAPFVATLLGITVFDWSYRYLDGQWSEARKVWAVSDYEKSAKTNMQYFANTNFDSLDSSCSNYADTQCLSTLHIELASVAKESKAWRDFLMRDIYQLMDGWGRYVSTFSAKFRASKILYRDIFAQLDSLEEAREDADRASATPKNIAKKLFDPNPAPIASEFPFFGLGTPVQEPLKLYVSKKENEELEKALNETAVDPESKQFQEMQKLVNEHLSKEVPQEKIDKKAEAIEQGKAAGLALIKDVLSQENIPKPYHATLVELESVLSQSIFPVEKYKELIFQLEEHFAVLPVETCATVENLSPKMASSQGEADEFSLDGFGLYSQCHAKYILEALGSPYPMGMGEKFIRLENEQKISKYGVDTNLAPQSYRGLPVNNMSEYTLLTAICGPDAVDEFEQLFKITEGYAPIFNPPRIVEVPWGSLFCSKMVSDLSLIHGRGFHEINLFQTTLRDFDGGEYTGVVDYLLKNISPEIKKMGFEKWWTKNVEPSVRPTIEMAETRFQSHIVDKLMNLDQYGKDSVMYSSETSDSWWRTESDVQRGVIPSIQREVNFYLDEVLLKLAPKLKFANTMSTYELPASGPRHIENGYRRFLLDYRGTERDYIQNISNSIKDAFVEMSNLYKQDKHKVQSDKALVKLYSNFLILKNAFQLGGTDFPGDPVYGDPLRGEYPFVYFQIDEARDKDLISIVRQTVNQLEALLAELSGYHKGLNAFQPSALLLSEDK